MKVTMLPDAKKTISMGEEYLNFLGTPHLCQDGAFRPHAPNWFIDALRRVHSESAKKIPKYNLSTCLDGSNKSFIGRVYFISDLHLFHVNIVKFVGIEKRPFHSTEEMNSVIVANILNTVSNGDILIIVGDITFERVVPGSGYPETNKIIHEIQKMGVYIINVIGNHDCTKDGHIMKLAVDEVYASLNFEYKSRTIFVSHYPVDVAFLDAKPGTLNLHGHTHASIWELPILTSLYPKNESEFRHISANIETTELRPMTIEELLARPGP